MGTLVSMSTVRLALTEFDLGDEGWRTLLRLARQRRRSLKDQTLSLILYALHMAESGVDVELSREALEALEPVA